jgi:hypothetical protein
MFGKTPGKITFYYNSDNLFNDVGLLSAYMTKNLAAESGSAMDEFAITDDEQEVFKICVKQTLPNIYESMLKITNGAQHSFSDEHYVTGEVIDDEPQENTLGRIDGKYVEISIKDNNAYNINVLTLVDSTIDECIKYGVLAEFYSINTNATLHSIAQSKFANCLLLLNQRLFQLKKKAVSPIF